MMPDRESQYDTPVQRHGRNGRLAAWLTVALWIVIIVAVAPLGMKLGTVQRDGAIDYLPADAESTRVAVTAATLPGGETHEFILVYDRPGGIDPADRTAAERHLTTLARRYPAPAAGGGRGGPAPRVVQSADGGALSFRLPVNERYGAAAEIVAALRTAVTDRPAGLVVTVTGPAAVEADLDKVFEGIDATLMLATVAVVALLLVLTYRSPVLWVIPLLSVGCAAMLSMAVVYLMVKALGITVSTQSASILKVLVFGAGTDYALLLVARYREELRRRPDVRDAMRCALRGAGPAIVASAATVAAGLLCLLAADMNNLRGLGPVAAAGVICTVLVMTTLFPALLVVLGRRIFWPAIPRVGSAGSRTSRGWVRLGEALVRRPFLALAVTVLALGGIASGLGSPIGDLREADRFTKQPESVAGFELLAAYFPELDGGPLTILTHVAYRDQVLAAAGEVSGITRAVPGRVGGGWAEILAFPAAPTDSPAERETIVALRDRVHTVAGADAMVGGRSAENLDATTTTVRDRNLVVPLVLAAVLLILILLLRAIVAPLLLIATVVLSFAAAMGASILIFQHVFGFPGLESTVPLLGFLFLVALGVDYNIFLMTRAREEAVRIGTRNGMLNALATTGGVITSAGLVLAATFAVLSMLPLVLMVELGFLVAFGVLLDTFVVRSVLVPALTFGLDRRIWWPGGLSRPGRSLWGAPDTGARATGARSAAGWRHGVQDVLLAVGVFAVSAGALLLLPQDSNRPVDAKGLLLVLAMTVPLAFRRRWPVAVVGVVVAASVTYHHYDYAHGPALPAVLIALYSLASTGPRKRWIAVGSLVCLAVVIAVPLWISSPPYLTLFGVLGWIVVSLLLGEAVRYHRAYAVEVGAREARAEHSRGMEARRRLNDERLRIARDLHDVLAHTIAAINVQAGVALHLLEVRPRSDDPMINMMLAMLSDTLRHVTETSRIGTAELRTTLDLLRGDEAPTTGPVPGLSRLDELTGPLTSTGTIVEVDITGEPRRLPSVLDVAAFRIVQEALTNVVRHTQARRIKIQIEYGRAALRLIVMNDGADTAASRQVDAVSDGLGRTNGYHVIRANGVPKGYGILGMTERASLVGGYLTAGPWGVDGFRVDAALPFAAPVPDVVDER